MKKIIILLLLFDIAFLYDSDAGAIYFPRKLKTLKQIINSFLMLRVYTQE